MDEHLLGGSSNSSMEERLIEAVKERPTLYNHSIPENRHLGTRMKLWKEISLVVGEPVIRCKQRWKSLRDRAKIVYNSQLTGSDKVEAASWHYKEMLSFLNETFKTANLPLNSGIEQKWASSINRNDWAPPEQHRVYSNNFKTDGFINIGNKRYLKSRVSPSLNITTSISENAQKTIVIDQRKLPNTPKPSNSTDEWRDEMSNYGRTVTNKLKKMSSKQRVFAEKMINEVLFHGEMEVLSYDGTIEFTIWMHNFAKRNCRFEYDSGDDVQPTYATQTMDLREKRNSIGSVPSTITCSDSITGSEWVLKEIDIKEEENP